VPISSIDFNRLGQHGTIVLKDIDGVSVQLHGRAKRVIFHSRNVIQSVLSKNPIGRHRDMQIQKRSDWKNNTYSFDLM
jgi:hypothetical protein